MSINITEQEYGIIILDEDFFLSNHDFAIFIEKMAPILMLSTDKVQILNATSSIFERIFKDFDDTTTKRLSVLSLYQDFLTPNSFIGFVVIEWGHDDEHTYDMSALIVKKTSSTIHPIIEESVSSYCVNKITAASNLDSILNEILDKGDHS